MDKNRLLTLALVIGMVAVAAMGWFFGISPLLDQARAASEEASSLSSLNDINDVRVASLKAEFENMDDLEVDLASLRESVPSKVKMPEFLREINEFTTMHGVTLTSIGVGDPVLWTPPEAPPAAPTDDVEPVPDAEAAEPPAPSELVQIPVQIVVSGGYPNIMAFIGSMQQGPRLYLMTSVSVTLGDGVWSSVIDGFVYALPSEAGDALEEMQAELEANPTPTPTPTPTAEPTVEPTPTEEPEEG